MENLNLIYKKPKGTIDYYGEEALKLLKTKEIIEEVFRENGGENLETPVFEIKEIIMGKYGEEAETKLVYNIQKPDIASEDSEQLVLKYDQTLPFIRFIKENGIKKMRRYSIGKVYRRDTPNQSLGRFREFYQCDFDILGEENESMTNEIQIFTMITDILKQLGITDYKIVYNDTENLKTMLVEKLGLSIENFKNVCQTIDKLDKYDFEDLIVEFRKKGLDNFQLTNLKRYLDDNYILNPNTQLKVDKINMVCNLLGITNLEFSNKLARGLDYYNGIIFEVKIPEFPTIIAGGRYDNLIDNTLIGLSIGLTRILPLISVNEKEPIWKETYTITTIGNVAIDKKVEIISWLKNQGKKAINYSLGKDKKLGKQITECIKNYDRFLVIIGEDEIKLNKFIIKDLKESTQETINLC
jgi:histidyl-tRNA synthetase